MTTEPVPDAGDALAAEYDLFAECLELDGATREARLARAAPELAARVRRLLEVHERSESGADAASLGGARKLALDVRGGPQIDGVLGPYRLQQKLGDGAMGEVYLAVQSEPVRRLVAVKLLRPGVATAEVVARFAAERQALEVMSHPGIARILDAGEAPDGRPYLVMEYVAGLPITDYCEQKRLKLRERVRLLAAVCRAVQHAHFKGVIHRDLKPSNVLVTEIDGAAQPKIIDFGVAKLLQGVAAEPDHYTKLGQLVGTPAYMSPEQALGSPIDVDLRADVFSLGAILYELAAGSAPNRSAAGEALHAVIARVQAGEIERPSERVRSDASARDERGERAVAHARGCGYATPALLARALADELDWIALHALERDRARRFASAEALAADLDRHLKGAAIESRPPTALYTLRKSLRRHRLGASVAATLVGASLVFAVTLVQHNRQLQAERDRANREAATARRVTDFVADMFELTDPGTAAERTVSARELLTVATRRMQERRVDESPLTQAELLAAAGRAHQGLGLFDDARKLLDDALSLRRQTGDSTEIATGLLDLATLDHITGEYAAAEKNAREALRLREQVLGSADASTLAARTTLGETLRLAGRMEPALAEYVAARRGFEAAGRTDLPEYGRALFGEGSVLVALGRVKEGEPVLRNAVEQLRRSLGELSLDTASARSNLAEAAMLRGDYPTAEALQRATLDQLRQLYGPRHPEVAMMLNNLGLMLTNAPGRAGEAVPLLEEALEQTREFRGPKHPATASMLNNLGLAEMTLGRNEAAIDHLREAVAIRTEVLGPANANTGGAKVNLAGALRNLGRPQEALRWASEGHATCSGALGAQHWRCANAQRVLGETLMDLKRFDDAERELQAALAALTTAMGPEHQRTVRTRDALARLAAERTKTASR